jgi:hypothetical protein
VRRQQPTPAGIALAVEGRPAVTPSELWAELGGDGDFAPGWVLEELRRLGYGPHPAGFWWASDLPLEIAEPIVRAYDRIEAAYPDDGEDLPC